MKTSISSNCPKPLILGDQKDATRTAETIHSNQDSMSHRNDDNEEDHNNMPGDNTGKNVNGEHCVQDTVTEERTNYANSVDNTNDYRSISDGKKSPTEYVSVDNSITSANDDMSDPTAFWLAWSERRRCFDENGVNTHETGCNCFEGMGSVM